MIDSWKPYVILSVIFLGSLLFFAMQFYLPLQNSIFREILLFITSLPALGTLVFGIYQLYRDRVAFERTQAIQQKEQFYNLSVTSHMAEIAFNKHVEFSEKYIEEITNSVLEAFRMGPVGDSIKTVNCLSKLSKLRAKYRPWITQDFLVKIKPFEDQLDKFFRSTLALEHAKDDDDRKRLLRQKHEDWSRLLGIPPSPIDGDSINERIVHEEVINQIQGFLGITELSKLRENIIKQAIKSI